MKVLIGGDYFPNRIKDITPERYAHVFDDIASIIDEADFSILNYESPIASEGDKLIDKDGPGLRSEAEAMKAVKDAGFDAITLANNHTLDFGENALLNTISEAERIGLDHVGAGKDIKDAAKVLYRKIGDKTLAVINCCEHEFSIAGHEDGGTNPINPVHIFYSVSEARGKADYVVIITHGGHEYYQLPSPRMQQLYRYFIDLGVDAVVNHHQHCYSGYEIYNGKPIVYGLGNLFFPYLTIRRKGWNEGYLAMLNLDGENVELTLYPYTQSAQNFRVYKVEDRREFDKTINGLNAVITDRKALSNRHRQWMKSQENVYGVLLAPYSNRWLRALARRGLLPTFLNKKRRVELFNLFRCEAHRDRIMDFLSPDQDIEL